MNNIELGKKIREIRISKKMTQSDVAGSFITRNMLSLIENGTATPSIRTLEYIAGVLEIPVEVLVSGYSVTDMSADYSAADKAFLANAAECIGVLTKAKSCYLAGLYNETIELLLPASAEDSPIYDEACSMLARSYYALADTAFKEGNYEQSTEYANKSVIFADDGIYASDELMMKAYKMLKTVQ